MLGQLPAGDVLLFNDWNPQPNTVSALVTSEPGSSPQQLFEAFRVWSLGASTDGSKIAFACGDPQQQANYGIAIGDAIQHSWLLEPESGEARVISYGNLSDECHSFSADEVLVCRRYDFSAAGQSSGYRIGSIALGCDDFEFLADEVPGELSLWPVRRGDELLYGILEIEGMSQSFRLMRRAADGSESVLREDASRIALSPDGERYAFTNHAASNAIFVAGFDDSEPVRVAPRGTKVTWSPDGTQLAMLTNDAAANCSHIDIYAADGSSADAPDRLLDCAGDDGPFITALAWVRSSP